MASNLGGPKDRILVKKYLHRRPFRAFQILNQLMKKAGVASVLASSPINLQEMTGIPFDQIKGDLLSLNMGRKIYLLSPRLVVGGEGKRIISHPAKSRGSPGGQGDPGRGPVEKRLQSVSGPAGSPVRPGPGSLNPGLAGNQVCADAHSGNPFFRKSIKKFEPRVFSDVSEEGSSKKRGDKTWSTS